jgi:hypothetical protein
VAMSVAAARGFSGVDHERVMARDLTLDDLDLVVAPSRISSWTDCITSLVEPAPSAA